MRNQALDIFLKLVKFGLGGRAGDGRQFVSWMHDRDFVRAVLFLIARDDISGPVNLASPNPLPNAKFMRDLRSAWGIPFGFPAEKWMIEIGSFFLRTESELVLKSRRVGAGAPVVGVLGLSLISPPGRKPPCDLVARSRAGRV